MNFEFDPNSGLIIIPVEVFGPTGNIVLEMALDTGATTTLINAAPLTIIGYDPSTVPDRIQVTTGSGVEYAPRLNINRLDAFGKQKTTFPIVSHTLPPSTGVDGLLGLDFFRGLNLNINFKEGVISVQ